MIIFLLFENRSILKNHILIAARSTAIAFEDIEKLFLWFDAEQLKADLLKKCRLIDEGGLGLRVFSEVSSKHPYTLISVLGEIEIECFRYPKGEEIILESFSGDPNQLSWLIKSALYLLALGRVEVPASLESPLGKGISTVRQAQRPPRWVALCFSWHGAPPRPSEG